MEDEHRRIISHKMKLAVQQRLYPYDVDFERDQTKNDEKEVDILDANKTSPHLSHPKSVQVLFSNDFIN